jgi:hypothetical protein
MEYGPEATEEGDLGGVANGRASRIGTNAQAQADNCGECREPTKRDVGRDAALDPTDYGVRHAGRPADHALAHACCETSVAELAPDLSEVPRRIASTSIRRTFLGSHGHSMVYRDWRWLSCGSSFFRRTRRAHTSLGRPIVYADNTVRAARFSHPDNVASPVPLANAIGSGAPQRVACVPT